MQHPSKDVTSFKRKFEKQQLSHLTSNSGTRSPAKKQKTLTPKDTGSRDPQNITESVTKSNLPLEAQPQSETLAGSHCLLPLSQPPTTSTTSRERERERLSLSQSTTDSQYKKGRNIEWKFDLPQSIHATRTPNSGKSPPSSKISKEEISLLPAGKKGIVSYKIFPLSMRLFCYYPVYIDHTYC